MRKIVLSVILIVTFTISSLSLNAQSLKNGKIYNGLVNYNLSLDGSKELENTSNANIFIEEYSQSKDGDISLVGEVIYGNKSYPVNIKGNMFNAKSFDNMLVGDMKDESENFDVVSFAIYSNSSDETLRANKNLVNEDVLQLYLLRKGTREFVMYEFNYSNIKSDFSSNFENVDSEEIKDINDLTKEHWWIQVYEPIRTNEKASTNGNSYDNTSTLVSGEAVHTDYEYDSISYQDGPGNVYRYTIELKLTGNIRDNTSDYDTFQLKVVDTNYYYNGKEMGGDFLCIYGILASAVLTGSNNADTYSMVDWGSRSTYKTGGLKFETSISIGASAGPIGGSLNWEPEEEVVEVSPPLVIDYGGYVRGIEIPYDAYIRSKGDNVNLVVWKDYRNNSSGKYSSALFTYKVGFNASKYEVLDSGSMRVSQPYQ